MKAKTILFPVCAALILAACETTPTQSQLAKAKVKESGALQLNAEDVRQVLTGNSISGRGEKREWNIYYQDGTMLGHSWGDGRDEKDNGVWNITESGEYCRTWKVKWGGGKKRCSKIYKTGEDELVFLSTDDSNSHDTATVTPGNTFNLE